MNKKENDKVSQKNKDTGDEKYSADTESSKQDSPGADDKEKMNNADQNDKSKNNSEKSDQDDKSSKNDKKGKSTDDETTEPAEKDSDKNQSSESDIDTQEEKKEDNDARYMRLAADFQNYKRRTEKEKQDIYKYANEKIGKDIIDVMDNFERALSHGADCVDKQFVEGVDMIYKQLKSVLDSNNIIEIECEGQAFDPNFHNAIMAEENSDCESGIVLEAIQKGYTLNGKVIRPAMVKVSK